MSTEDKDGTDNKMSTEDKYGTDNKICQQKIKMGLIIKYVNRG
jgi:hypothetical protein